MDPGLLKASVWHPVNYQTRTRPHSRRVDTRALEIWRCVSGIGRRHLQSLINDDSGHLAKVTRYGRLIPVNFLGGWDAPSITACQDYGLAKRRVPTRTGV